MEWLWTKLSGPVVSYQPVCTGDFEHGEGSVPGGCLWKGTPRLVSTESVREMIEDVALSDGSAHTNDTRTPLIGDAECVGSSVMVGHKTRMQVTRRK